MNSHSASPSATAAGSAFALSGAYSDYLGPAVPDSWRAALDINLILDMPGLIPSFDDRCSSRSSRSLA